MHTLQKIRFNTVYLGRSCLLQFFYKVLKEVVGWLYQLRQCEM